MSQYLVQCLVQRLMIVPVTLALAFALTPGLTLADSKSAYLIGRGMADITGPAFGMQMWGFGRADQTTRGIHLRQRSRAFVIAQADKPSRRLVFVSADLGSIEHHITLEVIERLQRRFADAYALDNVIISATHTHSGPGGYWHSRSDVGLDGGFYPEHFDAIVEGITASISSAHNDLQPGNIFIDTAPVAGAGVNRSVAAYMENPQQERACYPGNTDKEMTLLKFVDDSGAIGMLNWYALHPTAMNFYNRLISGDHKGYASLQVEQHFGTTYSARDDFVAAFAQSTPGDVTPNSNLDNTGPGATDVDSTRILGERQVAVAMQLFDDAQERLDGPLDSRQLYADLSNYEVEPRFTHMGKQTTCPSAYGYSFAGGSTEDGGGHFLFKEGMLEQNIFLDILVRLVTGAPAWTDAVKSCQTPKPILFETGSGTPPLQSQIRSISVARIGQLVILALPAEVTTMAARRLREGLMHQLGDWAGYVVIAGYSNGYAGYVTTAEEYALQHYEAGHTLHGPWTLAAYQQLASRLGAALAAGTSTGAGTRYDDWRGKSPEMAVHDGKADHPPAGKNPGDPLPLANTLYRAGATVTAEFWSSNPSAAYARDGNFLLVEHYQQGTWQQVANDAEWTTRVRWHTRGEGFVAKVSWETSADTEPGQYRITHLGHTASGATFSGTSEIISIQP